MKSILFYYTCSCKGRNCFWLALSQSISSSFHRWNLINFLLTSLIFASCRTFEKSRIYTKTHKLFANFWKIRPGIAFKVLMGAPSRIIRLLDIIWSVCSGSLLSYFWCFAGCSSRGLGLELSEAWEGDLLLDLFFEFMQKYLCCILIFCL